MRFLLRLYYPFLWRYRALKLVIPEYHRLKCYFGGVNTYEDQQKLRFLVIKEVHVIEKGLSLQNCRPGFGIPKVLNLLNKIRIFAEKFEDQELMVFSLSVVKRYVEFNRKFDSLDPEIEKQFIQLEKFATKWDVYANLCGGETRVKKIEIESASNIPFFDFVKSRHSVRTFTGEPVNKEQLTKAIEMASFTPSACNRQPWGVFVFTKKENIIKILDIQTGARQFKENVGALIIVTSTMKAFFGGENNQWFINGGMYSMSLIYAIHSLGLGCIPLNMGIPQESIDKIWAIGHIDSSQVPVLLIAVGHLPNEFNVAKSCRFPVNSYTVFD